MVPAPRDPKLCFLAPRIFFFCLYLQNLLSYRFPWYCCHFMNGEQNKRMSKGGKAFVNSCCCEREFPVELLVQSAVQIFGKTGFHNFPTTGCTSCPTEICLVLVLRNQSVLFSLLLVSSVLCLLRGNAPAVNVNGKFCVKNVPENLVTWFW